jgi:dolichyldiphosphatase
MDAVARPFSSTCVFYEEGDTVGYFAALFSLVPIFVMVSLATLLASRRDLHTLTFIAGKLADDAVNAVLKHVIAEARPPGPDRWSSSYGMPSNHSQFMAFLVAYAALWGWRRWRGAGNAWKTLCFAGVAAGALLVMLSRVHLRYHTPAQVAVGGAVGLVTGSVWFWVTEALLRPHFQAVAEWPVCRWAMVRDVGDIDVLGVEYEAARSAARKAAGVGASSTSLSASWVSSAAQATPSVVSMQASTAATPSVRPVGTGAQAGSLRERRGSSKEV